MSNVLFDQTTRYSQLWIQKCVLLAPEWKRLDAYLLRILEMDVAFKLASEDSGLTQRNIVEGKTDCLSVKGLDLVTKRGSCLAQNLEFELEKGTPMLVTGPSAAGKSLLGSILLGLWNPAGKSHSISIPGMTGLRPPLSTLMPAPQRIYLPVGNLLQQLLYPVKFDMGAYFRPPFNFVVDPVPDGITEKELMPHFVYMLGAQGVTMSVDGTSAIVTFPWNEWEKMMGSWCRPQDRIVNQKPMNYDFAWTKEGWPKPEAHDPNSPLPSLVRARKCMQACGIEHVLIREPSGWITEKGWEDVLSGGEQQRLCFARVLYYAPTFALLDECTSMVAADAEANLYRTLASWGITPLTLTQRVFMTDLYQKNLSLGVRQAEGWEMGSVSQ